MFHGFIKLYLTTTDRYIIIFVYSIFLAMEGYDLLEGSLKSTFIKQAEKLKAIGHPARLCIVRRLAKKDCNVSELQNCLDLPQSTVSQHLTVLKSRKIIKGKRSGVVVIYSLVDEDVKKILKVLFE